MDMVCCLLATQTIATTIPAGVKVIEELEGGVIDLDALASSNPDNRNGAVRLSLENCRSTIKDR